MAEQLLNDNSILSNPQTLQQWNNLLTDLFGGGDKQTNTDQTQTSAEVTSTNSAANPAILALISQLMPGASGGIANPQAQALIAAIFQQFKEQGLSSIMGMGNSAGVYNSSTQQLLANDALARAIAQSAGVVGDNQNKQLNVIANLLNTLSQGSRTQTRTGVQQQQTRQTSSQSGSAGNLAKAALGAAAARAAGRALNSNKNPTAKRSGENAEESKGDQEGDYPQYGQGDGRSDEQDDTSGMPSWTAPEDREIDSLDRAGADFGAESLFENNGPDEGFDEAFDLFGGFDSPDSGSNDFFEDVSEFSEFGGFGGSSFDFVDSGGDGFGTGNDFGNEDFGDFF